MNYLPQEKAKEHCLKLMELLDIKKNIDFETESPSSFFSTEHLFNEKGQMFGILVCQNNKGGEVILKAFSGQYKSQWTVKGWVPPLLDEEKFYSITKESDFLIHSLTNKINELELKEKSVENEKEILQLKKTRREMSRKSMEDIFELYKVHSVQPADKGKTYTFQNIFNLKKGTSRPNHHNKKKSKEQSNMPPTGCGECCAPKLLDYAALHNLRPVSLAEFYYGKENASQSRFHKKFYPPCSQKCQPLMKWLLGLDIIYSDQHIVIVNKKSGMLSVPGKGKDKEDCVVSRIKFLFKDCIEQPSVHRLDMDTSGLLILALDKESHKKLSEDFLNKKITKKYIALLEGKINLPKEETIKSLNEQIKKRNIEEEKEKLKNMNTSYRPQINTLLCQNTVTKFSQEKEAIEGIISLPFRLDIDNRPKQIFDSLYGKMGTTIWSLIKKINIDGKEKYLLKLEPLTGRTHQLRLACSSKYGLGCPIEGDNLYSNRTPLTRLFLHAYEIKFTHPVTKKEMLFSLPPDFI